MKNTPIALFCLLGFLPIAMEAEEIRVDWAGSNFGSKAARLRDPERRIVAPAGGIEGLQVVSGESQPASPFGAGAAALLVQSTPADAFWFRLAFRPFDAENTVVGVVDFNLHPVDGAINIQAGAQSEPWDPEIDRSYHIQGDRAFFSLSLIPGAEITIRGRPVETDSLTTISEGQNYRVTIKWNLTQGGAIVRVFLNGEVVRARGATEPLNIIIENKAFTGLNAFRISMGASGNNLGKVFIGPIAAASGSEPDMEQADDPLLKP